MPTKSLILSLLLIAAGVPAQAAGGEEGTAFFESKIRPLFVEKCYSCHSAGATKLKGGLFLDNRARAYKGGESGAAFVPGSPEKSRLIEAVGYKNEDLQMPPKGKLSDQQVSDLTAWIKMGAPWGKDAGGQAAARAEAFDLQKRKAEHWVWKPVTARTPPAVKHASWLRSDIDRFILAKLEEKGLSPAGQADRRVLLRRVCFDLTGLAPKPAEIDVFLNDGSSDAFAKAVDRLLASPRFGERWGRHWMDLVRYAETMGHEFDFPISNVWRYRDYIIDAFNSDLPYDQLVMEHVAGDLLPRPRRSADGLNQSVIGTGFWFMGEGVQAPVDVKQYQADVFDNRIDVFGKTFMGITVACARCHDHKFDAISTADYYAMYGYMKGTRYSQHAINDLAIAGKAEELKNARERLRRAVADAWLGQLDGLKEKEVAISTEGAPRSGDVDLAPHAMSDWRAEGAAFASTRPGDFVVGDEKHPIAAILSTTGMNSGFSQRLEGFVRSPTFTIDRRYLHVRARGEGARLSIVVDNFTVIRDPIYGTLKRIIKSDAPKWITVDLKMWQGRQAYLEFADVTVPDPGGPGSGGTTWAAVERALLSNDHQPPTEASKRVRLMPRLRGTIEMWRDGTLARAKDARERAAALSEALRSGLPAGSDSAVLPLVKEFARLEGAIPAPLYALAAADGSGGDECIFIRGSYKNRGPIVHRRMLEAVCGADQPAPRSGSGRLELARRMVDPANPLTARVYVNRIWHHLFGRGIVASVDNFGKLGEAPSHPELLDYLADRFVKEGWSTKKLIREIVLSSVYRMSSRADAAADQADPDNRLFHRANVRRLEGEAIRDHLLQVSGRLDLTMGGPSVRVHLTPFMEGRGRPGGSGPLDGAGRRSVYIEVRRNFLTPMLLAFDVPTPFNTMGRRTVSNVPAQALILMNDPFVLEESKQWARMILSDPRATPRSRIESMYLAAFSRPPTAAETEDILEFADRQGGRLGIAAAARLGDARVWTDIAQALINTKEFIFIN